MNKNIEFAKLGLGLFLHYGLFSVLGSGEWAKYTNNIPDIEYEKLAYLFNPKMNFSDEICSFAKENGFNYIVFTARHHDGFSLYDTKDLNDYNSYHYIKRDIVQEFILSCKKYNLLPIIYHTLIDWKEEKNFDSFSDYLSYLRNSIDLLCSNYGQIGGFWFDGEWKYPNYDWEEEKLYKMINRKQPNALIINNSGLSKLGERNSEYINVITFEGNKIANYDYHKSINLYAAEACQTLNDHWGYAKNDINYKSIKEILLNFLNCRRYGGNYLLNIGPKEDGSIREYEKEFVNLLGNWINLNKEALFNTVPYEMNLPSNSFALRNDNNIYIIIENIPMIIDNNVGIYNNNPIIINLANLKYKKIYWLDNKSLITTDFNQYVVEPFNYGNSMIARILKIEL